MSNNENVKEQKLMPARMPTSKPLEKSPVEHWNLTSKCPNCGASAQQMGLNWLNSDIGNIHCANCGKPTIQVVPKV